MIFYRLLWFFVIFGFLGWCLEVIYSAVRRHRFVNRGFLSGPICPIYGIGLSIVYLLLYGIRERWLLLFGASVLLTTALEFAVGFLMDVVFHHKWWDYSDRKLNVCGYVCLPFSFAWGLICMLTVKLVFPPTEALVNKIPIGVGAPILAVFYLLLLLDTILSCCAAGGLSVRISALGKLGGALSFSSEMIGKPLFLGTVKVYDGTEIVRKEYNRLLARTAAAAERLLDAFPTMSSPRYNEQIKALKRNLEASRRKRSALAGVTVAQDGQPGQDGESSGKIRKKSDKSRKKEENPTCFSRADMVYYNQKNTMEDPVMKYYLAIDFGASSGRHIVGWEENGEIMTEEVYRFPNGMDEKDGHLVWDTDRLLCETVTGIKKAFEKYPEIESLSIDTWGVDYVLLRGDEEIKPTYAYRDYRMDEVIDDVHAIIPFEKLYEKTGIQFQKFNTVYQLYADKKAGRLEGVTDFLMLPEYLMYKLTGVRKKEFTDATTTGMVNVDTLQFDEEIFEKLGYPKEMAKTLEQPGTFVGRLKPEIAKEVGGDLNVLLCATHDTGSAVEAIEMEENAPYISSGTWSLLGVKTPHAVNDEKSRETNYSNEGGVGYNRYQKNITGMWIIQSLRKEMCPDTSFPDIADLAEKSSFAETFDVNDERFSAPKSMKEAIEQDLAEHGKPAPVEMGDYFNAAYVSLGVCYDEAIRDLEANTGNTYSYIYIVGGGAKNGYLNGITEKYTGKKVVALPIEATAIGNLKVQMKAATFAEAEKEPAKKEKVSFFAKLKKLFGSDKK